MMKTFVICFELKRAAQFLFGVLISLEHLRNSDIKYGKLGNKHYLEFPDTDITAAALKGFLADRRCGYLLGGTFPEECEIISRPIL